MNSFSTGTAVLAEKLKLRKEIFCSGLFLSARWFVFSKVAQSGLHLLILPNKEAAEYCAGDLYHLIEGDRVFFLPDSGQNVERSNYKSSLSVQRTAALSRLSSYQEGELLVLVTYPQALAEPVPSRVEMAASVIRIRKDKSLSYALFQEQLSEKGFERVDFVSAPGQFAVRGSLIDVFSYSYNDPFRISFFGDEVEKIHVFDCNTQLSKEERDSVEIYSDLADDKQDQGVSLCTELPENTWVWLDSSDMYRQEAFFSELPVHRVYLEIPVGETPDEKVAFHIAPQPVFNKNFELLTEDIRKHLETGYRVLIYGEKRSQLDRLKSILSQEEGGVLPEFVPGKNLHAGFIDHDEKICHYSDHEIFDRFHRVVVRRSVEKSEQLTLNDLTAFKVGDYIVHIDHGIGIFGGLVRLHDEKGRVREVVKLMYKDNDIVYVSVHSLHKISRYRSQDGEAPKIHKLGSKSWQNLKASAKSRVKDIAKDLIQLYAKRRASKGFAFSPDSYLQEELESSFMYEDTPDQMKATQDVKRDMEDNCPMDRLICGDVGFGKTEIALRAAFKAVGDNKQVAVLVPTTILALQHYNTFCNRLKDFPCTVEFVSRLRTAKQISDIRKRLEEGRIDILIGTHKILGKEFIFKDLGLLIIDEEQKFGVSAKEKLRQMKASVDTLTLTATPIPRTLQFSLLGARDLSIIHTPPPNRIPIQTEIILFDQEEIKGILNYELNRQGQIFFVHNKVEELPAIADILHRLVPDMKICIAHGQMESKQLEDRMMEFMAGDYDLLLCTTIVENGLDIPNANTILISQAQNIGLSDLHQLRGRVGRSNRRAFCYLIVPPLVSITDDARRRLRAIEEFSDLGSGFNIAMQDLDIRGAGNLLGAEQSGYIADMGYEAYQKILSEAMEELGMESGVQLSRREDSILVDTVIETDRPALIPDSYIDLTAEKIRLYKELDSTPGDKELDLLHTRIEDRFGPIPQELENLFDIVRIRQAASRMGFEKIIVKNGLLIGFFIGNPLSSYYKGEVFATVLQNINAHTQLFELKQSEGRLKIVSRNVDSTRMALDRLRKLIPPKNNPKTTK